ncbi:hypothetical protein Anapl_16556 [Anas platyrhynchos]|uniref:Uncharacterized protein n=1 Tax=Anas platyrhynchos TaxID=8839 RepID=R0JLX7_ANAPL|nr:hypothetical protein Anapl_16556 [Anas platyrhynchos]
MKADASDRMQEVALRIGTHPNPKQIGLKAVEQDARCLFTAWRMPNLPLSFRMHKNLSFDTAASKNKWRSNCNRPITMISPSLIYQALTTNGGEILGSELDFRIYTCPSTSGQNFLQMYVQALRTLNNSQNKAFPTLVHVFRTYLEYRGWFIKGEKAASGDIGQGIFSNLTHYPAVNTAD